MEEFYFVVASGTDRKTIERIGPCNVMLNIASKSISIPKNREKLFIDSGGYSFFTKFEQYQYTPEQYLDKIQKYNPTFFANMDIPCEPQIIQKRDSSVKEHIETTLSNQAKILDIIDDGLKEKFVPVVQGWRIGDYLYCIDRMKEQGLLSDYMAVGSVCRRNATSEIRKIILAISNELPRTKLHAFGVKLSILRDKVCFERLHSCDSASWHFEDMFTKCKKKKKFSHIKSKTERNYLVAKDWKKRLDETISRSEKFWKYQHRFSGEADHA